MATDAEQMLRQLREQQDNPARQQLDQLRGSQKEQDFDYLNGLRQSILQGITFGFSDEITGIISELTGGDYASASQAERENQKKFAKENLFVAGYCNEVICYIPSRRVLDEGGYESNSSMVSYILPGPLENNIVDLSNKAREAKNKMDNGGSKEDYERTYNAFQDYVNKLKNEAKT